MIKPVGLESTAALEQRVLEEFVSGGTPGQRIRDPDSPTGFVPAEFEKVVVEYFHLLRDERRVRHVVAVDVKFPTD